MNFIKIFYLLSTLSFISSKLNQNDFITKNLINENGNDINQIGTHLFVIKLESLNPNEVLHFYVDFNTDEEIQQDTFKYYFINENIEEISEYNPPSEIEKTTITNFIKITETDDKLTKCYFEIFKLFLNKKFYY